MEFIYYKFYKLAEKGKSFADYYFAAIGLFSMFIFFNILSIGILLSALKIVDVFAINEFVLLLFIIIHFIFFYFYFTKNSKYKSIVNKYDNTSYPWVKSMYFWLYVIISFFLPPCIIIRKSQVKGIHSS